MATTTTTLEVQTQHHFINTINITNNNNNILYLNPNAQEFHPNHSLNYNYYHTNHHYNYNYPSSYNYFPFNNNNNFQYCPSQLPLDHHLYYYHHFYYNNIVQNYHITLPNLPPPPPPPPQPPSTPPPPPLPPVMARGRKTSLGVASNNGVHGNRKGDGGKGQNGKLKCRVSRGWKKEREKIMEVNCDRYETTVMIRNIPNQYKRMLTKFLDEFCNAENQKLLIKDNNVDHPSLAYDFLYLPIDFKTKANKGYAFVNFTHPIAVWKLHQSCSNKEWKHCLSSKKCQIAYAAIQGKEKLLEHFGKSRFVCDNAEYLPVCFSPSRDGSGASVSQTTIGEYVPLSSSHLRN